jgi:hypothetical protein
MSTVPVRLIDPRGHRFGAGFSVVLLSIAFIVNSTILVAIVGIALGVSGFLGTRWSALGRPWPYIRRALSLGPPAELEPELGPRFAQALGSVALALAVVLLIVAPGTPLGWIPVAGVGVLQTLLAVTGYCLGCRLYGLHWFLPQVFDRTIFRVTRRSSSTSAAASR